MNTPITTTADRVIRAEAGTRYCLRQLGYDEGAITQAIEHADFTTRQDVPSFLARHTVIGAGERGYLIIGHPEPPAPSPAPWPDLARDRDVSEILKAVRIIDAHLDDAAPEIYRQDPAASAELNEARALANRWRRIAAGPASEGQESVDALNLATGGNPRKGVIGDDDTILGELGDTASSALLAIQSITKDTDLTWAFFIAALAKALGRVSQGDLMRTFQGFIDADLDQAGRTAEFTVDGAAYYRVTPGQRDALMARAPAGIRQLNTTTTKGDPS